jgi:hypothetical protein
MFPGRLGGDGFDGGRHRRRGGGVFRISRVTDVF